jgi:hypothetical protein
MEHLDYNLLFRRFVSTDARTCPPEVFRMNRERFLRGDIAAAFWTEVWAEAKAAAVVVRRALHIRRDAA